MGERECPFPWCPCRFRSLIFPPSPQGLKISAAEFDRLDLDKDGWLNRDEFYLFFYGWLSSKIPTDEVISAPYSRPVALPVFELSSLFGCKAVAPQNFG